MNAPILPASLLPPSLAPSLSSGASEALHGEILPHQLPEALERCPGARVLSLDCFDTLLWRDSHAPADIFAALPGTSVLQRRWAESSARRAAGFGAGRQEVSILEIYGELLANATPQAREAAISAELAAEAAHCFAFAPAVALMRDAKARGLQVVIVSDTYLDAAQLRALIAGAAGEAVAALIDRIFVSSAYGKPKAGGLYAEVLRKLSARPHEILHIGDNKGADVTGVAPFGVNTLHLRQFSASVTRRLRLEAATDAMIHPPAPADADTHHTDPRLASALQPHRAALALAEPTTADPATRFGLTVLGPVMAGFERWLRSEAEALRATAQQNGGSGKVHWLFLMRDGHLPMLVHARGDGLGCPDGDPGHALEISRFTATAASFTGEADALRHATREIGTMPGPLARQLLIPEADIASLLKDRSPQDASLALLAELRKPERRRAIAQASRAMGRRLVAHVRRVANPAPGDTLMLVDLGYNGTVQNRIDALLSRELGVHVAGRYLLLREMDRSGLDKAGFLDARHYDPPTLEALCANVAVLEQLSTTTMGSVVDYTEEGEPIRRANDIGKGQSVVRDAVQAGVLAFLAAVKDASVRAATPHAAELWRRGAASVLARIMYLPCPEELAVIASFEHDVNLGTERKVALFDPAVARRGLRQRGLFYLKGSERMYLPAELAGHGLAPRLTLFAAKRFGLPLAFADFSDATIELPVIFADSVTDTVSRETVTATATHDGFYLAAIPVGDGRYTVAAGLGAIAQWVEVDSITLADRDKFLGEGADDTRLRTPLAPLAEGMAEVAPGLWHAREPGGFLLVRPPERIADAQLMVALVFRPIVPRAPTVPRDANAAVTQAGENRA